MSSARKQYYTYVFGSLGQAIETARRTGFFQWFHLEETERRPEAPGEVVRFRPSGDTFRNLCHLDVLVAANGNVVGMDLVVQRSFIDGRDALFAQDLVKSFLQSALPDACCHLLHEFMSEINLPGGNGATPGYLVFRGRRTVWEMQTGWSRVALANLPTKDAPSLVVHVEPNPAAPNAELVE